MSSFRLSPLSQNPFTRPAFCGRRNELQIIYKRLLSEPPQCCAIIGESYIGKTSLMRYLAEPQNASVIDVLGAEHEFTFVYLNCARYIELSEMGAYASAKFWWDMYSALWARLQPYKQATLPEPEVNKDQASIDTALKIKSELEELIRSHQYSVVYLLDNFEGIARLPLRDSEWLRSMAQRCCAYVVTSRHRLYLLYQYHPESWASPSPLWNLFADSIYLSLLPEDEVQNFLLQASEQANQLGSCWEQRDIDFIRKISGRHPELMRIACMHLFEQRLHIRPSLKKDEHEFLEIRIYQAASPICNQLWYGLADSELWDVPGAAGYLRGKETKPLSPYQQVLIDIANGREITSEEMIFVLEQRGLIEWREGRWHVFADVMRQFVLKQEQARKQSEPNISNQPVSPGETGTPAFAYLEGRVYEYLKSHVGEVCDREEIKRAVWGNNPPTNSALQKIIERIREKIELDPENPRYLIAVRGQGFMLREDPLEV